ncbi:MAG: type II secretion system F family protein, partial [Candidatus Thorarchaeota archaeon]
MPNAYRRKIEDLIKFSGSRNTPNSFFNKTVFMSLIFAVMVSVIFRDNLVYAFIVGFLIPFALFHGFLLLAVEKRTKFVERVLPDALQLMAANIKSGFIPSRAMLLSARKEFGPLSEAIKKAGKEMLTGKSLEESITGISKSIRSEIVEVTTKLIIRGIRSGGQLVLL